jgi:hypothetical protein
MSGYTPYRSPVKSKLGGLASLFGALGASGAFGEGIAGTLNGTKQMEQQNDLTMQRDSQQSVNRMSEAEAQAELNERIRKRTEAEAYQKQLLEGRRIADANQFVRSDLNSTITTNGLLNPLESNQRPISTPTFPGAGALDMGEIGLRERLIYGNGPAYSNIPQQEALGLGAMNDRFNAQTLGQVAQLTQPNVLAKALADSSNAAYASNIGQDPELRAQQRRSALFKEQTSAKLPLGEKESVFTAPVADGQPPVLSTGILPSTTVVPGAVKYKDPKTGMEFRDDPKTITSYSPATSLLGNIKIPTNPPPTAEPVLVPRASTITPMPSYAQPDASTAFKIGPAARAAQRSTTLDAGSTNFAEPRLAIPDKLGVPDYIEPNTSTTIKRGGPTPQQQKRLQEGLKKEYDDIIKQLKSANTPNSRGGRMSKQQYEDLKAQAEKLASKLGL